MVLLQFVLYIFISPVISGFITKIKNNIRMRKGPGIFQPYNNLAKLFSKGEVVSDVSSWIFKATPFVLFASSLTAALLVPLFTPAKSISYIGDFLALIFVMSIGRFFLALSALDTGSAFGGMGSSREMFISSLVEPVLCLVIFSLSLQFGSTNVAAVNAAASLSMSSLIAGLALFIAVIAETSRVPVDNQETHLELTMIHEAMVLEYSGKSLALIEMSSYIKQMVWFILICRVILPLPDNTAFNLPPFLFFILWDAAGLIIVSIITAVIEISVAKMRLFRAVDFLVFAFVLACVATVCAVIGV